MIQKIKPHLRVLPAFLCFLHHLFLLFVFLLSAQYSEIFSKARIHRMKGSTLPVSEALTSLEGTRKSALKRIVSGFLQHNC